jgi:hypothetical protein
MNETSVDIVHIIFGFLDFISKIRFRSTSKYNNKLEIHDFYNIEKKYLDLLDDKILLNYPYIKYLNARNNQKITNVNHMAKSLTELDASGKLCGISDEGIIDLKNITKLNVNNNFKITNINHMAKSLTELDASGCCCTITNKAIENLKNIIKLNVSFNSRITDINHMNNISELNASSFLSGIADKGIKNINLRKLNAWKNDKITNVNHMDKLIELYVSDECAINYKKIKNLHVHNKY